MPNQLPDSLIPGNEADRLRTLHRYNIVNTTPDKVFDDFVALSAQLFNVPISLISLVDEDRVWFTGNSGFGDSRSVKRNESICSAAILQDTPTVYPDLEKERCQLVNPEIAESEGLRFYAGTPLKMPDDVNIGTLCIISREPREIVELEMVVLKRIAQLVSYTIDLRGVYLASDQQEKWVQTQQELEAVLLENMTLARYLTSRYQGSVFSDEKAVDIVMRRLQSIENYLTKQFRVASSRV